MTTANSTPKVLAKEMLEAGICRMQDTQCGTACWLVSHDNHCGTHNAWQTAWVTHMHASDGARTARVAVHGCEHWFELGHSMMQNAVEAAANM